MLVFGSQFTPVLGTNALTQNIQFGQHLLLSGTFASTPTIALPNLPNQNGASVMITNISNRAVTVHGNVSILGLNNSGNFTLGVNGVVVLMAVSLTSPTTNNWYIISSDVYAAASNTPTIPSTTFANYSSGVAIDFGENDPSHPSGYPMGSINGSLDVPITYTVPHNIGRTPAMVMAEPRNLLYKTAARNFTATTFDLQIINVLNQGSGLTFASNLTVDWIAIG